VYVLSKGPDHRARVFNRCFINGFLFRTTNIEKNLTTQNLRLWKVMTVDGDHRRGREWLQDFAIVFRWIWASGREKMGALFLQIESKYADAGEGWWGWRGKWNIWCVGDFLFRQEWKTKTIDAFKTIKFGFGKSQILYLWLILAKN
jgi:hypothetical protein